jgi:hypothetical protein
MEEIKNIKSAACRCSLPRCQETINLIDTIEALQQENDNNLEPDIKSYKLTIDMRDELIEQLKAQAMLKDTNLRDLAEIARGYANHCERLVDDILKDTEKCLAGSSAEYHNPADMAALKQASEALKMTWSETDEPWEIAQEKAHEAIATIDKQIGGGEGVR